MFLRLVFVAGSWRLAVGGAAEPAEPAEPAAAGEWVGAGGGWRVFGWSERERATADLGGRVGFSAGRSPARSGAECGPWARVGGAGRVETADRPGWTAAAAGSSSLGGPKARSERSGERAVGPCRRSRPRCSPRDSGARTPKACGGMDAAAAPTSGGMDAAPRTRGGRVGPPGRRRGGGILPRRLESTLPDTQAVGRRRDDVGQRA